MRNLYWKTSFCCLSDDDDDNDDDAGGALTILWILRPDEKYEERQEGTERNVKGIYFYEEEELEVQCLS